MRFIHQNNLEQNIHFIDCIPFEKFPDYLNNIRFFVLPSTREGLPNSVLEAMACGTIVVSTPVGGVPGIITDDETGFIMKNNSVSCIQKTIMRALNTPDLERIAVNAHSLVQQDYSIEPTLSRYGEILEKMEES
jgi:glycosyltransferase involved in cell wall biosynthesis